MSDLTIEERARLATVRDSVATRQPITGLTISHLTADLEFGTPEYEAQTLARTERICAGLRAFGSPLPLVLGVRDRIQEPIEEEVDGMLWRWRELRANESISLPQVTHTRLRAVEAANLTFTWWAWAEELPARNRPQFTVAREFPTTPRQASQAPRQLTLREALDMPGLRANDPRVLHVLDELHQQRHLSQRQVKHFDHARKHDTFREYYAKVLDPMLVGIVATGPNRGVWVLIGKWLHQ